VEGTLLERVDLARRWLERRLTEMAEEAEEYQSEEESSRLQYEATGLLIALREFWLHVPEAFGASRERWE